MQDLGVALEQARSGDPRGFVTVVERFQDMAVGYAYSVLGDFHLAEDAAQEAFTEAYLALHKVYGPEAFASWFRKIIFKRCDRISRRRRLPTTRFEGISVASRDGDPAAMTEARELRADLHRAFDSLSAKVRSVSTLFYISDYSHREISEFLGVPVTTVKSRLHQARRHLRERMVDMVEEDLHQNRPSRDKSFAAKVQRGLRDVYVDRTEASLIDGERGKLLYRGYSIDDLAEHSSFEEVSYLMLHGALPSSAQLDEFSASLKTGRELPREILSLIREMKHVRPIDVLRTAVSAMGGFSELNGSTTKDIVRHGTLITASVPTMLAAHFRISSGANPVSPNGDLGHSANFLYMLSEEVPDPADANVLDEDLVLHAEHGANASTFAARTVASTGADLYSAVTAAIAALKGPTHGGAAESVIKMALEIGSADRAHEYLKALFERGGRVAGFGHAVYKTEDPRAVQLEPEARALAGRKSDPAWFSALEAVRKEMEPYSKRGIGPNLDLWSGAIYHLLGIPQEMFSSVFAMGRIPGWVAHVMEQNASRVLIRPRLEYDGPVDLKYEPIEKRS